MQRIIDMQRGCLGAQTPLPFLPSVAMLFALHKLKGLFAHHSFFNEGPSRASEMAIPRQILLFS